MSNQSQIRFKLKEYIPFIATRSFDLGQHAGLKIGKGDEVEFDGTVMRFAGMEVSQPQLRGAVRMGWLVPADVYDPNARQVAPAANIQMRPADGGDPMNPNTSRTASTTVAAEEQEVMDVGQHAAQTRDRNTENYRRTPRSESTQGQRSNSPAIEEQDGTVVRSVNTPARQDTNLGKETVGQAIAKAQATSKIVAGETRLTQEQMLANMTDEERAEYLAEVQARKAQYVVEQDSQVVGHVGAPKPVESTGIKTETTVGGGTEIADPSTGERAAQNEVRVEEGIKFTTTAKAVKKPAQPQAAQPVDEGSSRQIAKAICPDFPDNYVFTDPTRKKIARLQADYEDRPDIIRAVAAADTDPEVRTRLLAEFPQAFQG